MSLKLFQHLVNENELRGASEKIKAETMKLFKDGGKFKGINRTYSPLDVDGDPLPEEIKKVVTTVPQRLAWTHKPLIDLLDFEATRDKTNLKATADLVVEDRTIAKNVPTSTLLALEKHLRAIRAVYDTIPTLDLSSEWVESNGEKNIFKYEPPEQYRTAKKTEVIRLAAATDKHAEQVKTETVDKTIGTFKTIHRSGSVQPGVKAQYIENIDDLISAVKKARMSANEVEVETMNIGKGIFDFIHKEDESKM